MPHLTLPVTSNGPLLEFLCGVSQPRARALQRANLPIPAPVSIRGMVDTGASITVIDSSVLLALGVDSTGTTPVHTPSTSSGSPHIANLFDVSIALVHPTMTRAFSAVAVIEVPLAHQGIQALIGRDILSFCLMCYDGQAETFSLGF